MLWWWLFVWYLLAGFYDFSVSNDIPPWVNMIPLAAGLWVTFQQFGLAAVGWLLAVVLSTEAAKRKGKVLLAISLVGLLFWTAVFAPGLRPVAVGWTLFVLFWLLGVSGGADSLAGMTLMLFYPTWAFLIVIHVAKVTWHAVLMALRYGGARQAAIRAWVVFTTGARGTPSPGLMAYALALVIPRVVGMM